MKRLMMAMACIALSGSALADSYSEKQFSSNPVLQPLTLPGSMLVLGGGVGYGKKHDDDEDWLAAPIVDYGVTDNFTVGLDGLTYRFYHSNGLQLAVNTGFRNSTFKEGNNTDGNDDKWRVAYGTSVFGKQVFTENFALTFGAEYVYWDSDHDRDNRHEWDYSVGMMYGIAPDWTLSLGYTYRDLSKDFTRNGANVFSLELRRSFGNDFEVGMFASLSNQDAWGSDTDIEHNYRTVIGVNATWRF